MACYIEVPQDQEIESIPDSGYAPFNFPAEGAYLPFFFTDETFTKVMSSVLMGSYLLYGDMATQVRWWFLQNVEFPMAICAQIIDCVLNDADVQNALAQAILNSDAIRKSIQAAAVIGSPITEGAAEETLTTGCDLDVLFAQITGIVDQMDRNNRDFLEIIAVGTNARENLARLIGAIPILETLPIDDIIAYSAKMQDEILTNYNAQWTDSVRDEIRCALFCMARDQADCELSYDDIMHYFEDRLGHFLDPLNFALAVVQYFIAGTWSGTSVVDIMFLNQIAIWRQAGEWLGMNLRSLHMVTQLSGNIPDSDWELLCTDCPPPVEEICYDLVAAANGWDPGDPLLCVYHAGQGLGVGGYGNISTYRDNPPFEVTKIIITTNAAHGSWQIYRDHFGVGVGFSLGVSGTEYTFTLASPILTSDVAVGIIAVGPLSPTLRITDICLYSE